MQKVIIKPEGKKHFKLACSYEYRCKLGFVKIPEGYVSNGADVPRVFWWLFAPYSPEYISAVFIHDFLCEKNKRKFADAMLREAMLEIGVSKLKVWVFYEFCKTYHRAMSFLKIQPKYE